ncbi:MAG TPA: hypothetical protein VES42_27795 [Pilimelia sp.]|nr:hypothetical protein [Pilimelia sp.]
MGAASLTQPGRSRADVQRAALGEHPQHRHAAVTGQWQHLGWMARRRTTRDELAAAGRLVMGPGRRCTTGQYDARRPWPVPSAA